MTSREGVVILSTWNWLVLIGAIVSIMATIFGFAFKFESRITSMEVKQAYTSNVVDNIAVKLDRLIGTGK